MCWNLANRGLSGGALLGILSLGGDIGAIASSPEGRKFYEDLKTLLSHPLHVSSLDYLSLSRLKEYSCCEFYTYMEGEKSSDRCPC